MQISYELFDPFFLIWEVEEEVRERVPDAWFNFENSLF
jgi:hypothetical protein